MTEPPRKARNPNARAVFAANKSRIAEMLGNDRLMSEIFAELQFPGSYTQFTRYCGKAFKPAAEAAPAKKPPRPRPVLVEAQAAPQAPANVAAEGLPEPRPIRPAPAPSREWNPGKLKKSQVLKARTDET